MHFKKIGLAQFYPWRPHAAQRDYLARAACDFGLSVSELICDGSFVKCYDKQYQTIGFGSIDHCLKCRLGRSRVSHISEYFSLDWSTRDLPVAGEGLAMLSNQAALVRAETVSDMVGLGQNEGVLQAYRVGYHSAIRWIESSAIDLIVLFNGRIDLLKGVMDAAKYMGIEFASYERSWFGNGIMMIPGDNCLGLKLMHDMCRTTSRLELTSEEEASAVSVIERRVHRSGSNEWRDFQTTGAQWRSDVIGELGARPEVLVLPSSTYEVLGHPDWVTGWPDNFEALDVLQSRLGVDWAKWVIRGHPIWAQKVGKATGEIVASRYREFCRKRGARYIEADSTLHTAALIDASDLVILNGGSAVIEAIWKKKPVISLSESVYRFAELCPTLLGPGGSFALADVEHARKNLIRFIHTMTDIMPTFVHHLVSVSPSEQVQYAGANFNDVISQVRERSLIVPGKNTSKVGPEIETRKTLARRLRGLVRAGDA